MTPIITIESGCMDILILPSSHLYKYNCDYKTATEPPLFLESVESGCNFFKDQVTRGGQTFLTCMQQWIECVAVDVSHGPECKAAASEKEVGSVRVSPEGRPLVYGTKTLLAFRQYSTVLTAAPYIIAFVGVYYLAVTCPT